MTIARICHGCRQIAMTHKGYCADCQPTFNTRKNTRPIHREIHNTARWRTARKRALTRDAHTCTRCGQPANTAHHADNYDDPFNVDLLETLCQSCHGRIDGQKSHQPSRATMIGGMTPTPIHTVGDPCKYPRLGLREKY